MRVLVVEDEVELASLVRERLREEGLLAGVAIKGEDALWMAASSHTASSLSTRGSRESTVSR